MLGELDLPDGVMRRTITPLEQGDGWRVDDAFQSTDPSQSRETEVLWQLAPLVRLDPINLTTFRLELGSMTFALELRGWHRVDHWSPQPGDTQPPAAHHLRGVCSPAFRQTQLAPFILLRGKAQRSDLLQTSLRRL